MRAENPRAPSSRTSAAQRAVPVAVNIGVRAIHCSAHQHGSCMGHLLHGRIGTVLPHMRHGPTHALPSDASGPVQLPGAGQEVDFDDLVIDDKFLIDELGLTPEELEEQRALLGAGFTDPEGLDLDFDPDKVSSLPEDVPEDVKLAMLDKAVYGPEAVVLAGFRPDELGVVRAVLDAAGGSAIKVLPATSAAMLQASVDEIVWSPERDWSTPADDGGMSTAGLLSGGWGAQRVVLFSGLSVKAQATVVELFEGVGFTNVAAGMVLEHDGPSTLGSVLAAAIKETRDARKAAAAAQKVAPNASKDASAEPGQSGQPLQRSKSLPSGMGQRMVSSLSDLPPLEQLLAEKVRQQEEELEQQQFDDLDEQQAAEHQPSVDMEAEEEGDVDNEEEGAADWVSAGSQADAAVMAAESTQPVSFPKSEAERRILEAVLAPTRTVQPGNLAPKAGADAAASAQGTTKDVPGTANAAAKDAVERPAVSETTSASQSAPATNSSEPVHAASSFNDLDNPLDELLNAVSATGSTGAPAASAASSAAATAQSTAASQLPSPTAAPKQGTSLLARLRAAREAGASVAELETMLKQATAAESMSAAPEVTGAAASSTPSAAASTPASPAQPPQQQLRASPKPAAPFGKPGVKLASTPGTRLSSLTQTPMADASTAAAASVAESGSSAERAAALRERARAALAASKQAYKSAKSAAGPAAGTGPAAAAASSTPTPQSSKSASSGPAAARQVYGPAPPPPASEAGAGQPLLNVRPEVMRQLQGKNVKFVDLSKLPSKYRTQMAAKIAARRQAEKAAAAGQTPDQTPGQPGQTLQDLEEWAGPGPEAMSPEEEAAAIRRWQQEMLQKQGSQAPTTLDRESVSEDPEDAGAEGAGARSGRERSSSSSGLRRSRFGLAGARPATKGLGGRMRVQAVRSHTEEDEEWEEEEEEEEEEVEEQQQGAGEGSALTEPQVTQLVHAAKAAGLDPEQMLAEAMALGVRFSRSAVAKAGVAMPDQATVEAARARLQEEVLKAAAEDPANNGSSNTPRKTAAHDSSSSGSSSSSSGKAGVTSGGRPRDLEVDIEEDGVEDEEFEGEEEEGEDSEAVQYNVVGEDGVVDIEHSEVRRTRSTHSASAARTPPSSSSPPSSSVPPRPAHTTSSSGGSSTTTGGSSGSSRTWGSGWARPSGSTPANTQRPASGSQPIIVTPGTISITQLRAAAERRGVPLEQLLADARAKGVTIADV